MNTQRRAPQQQAYQNMPGEQQYNFQEPPEVTIIEASCKQATKKSADNSEWTNVLKEPMMIRKGSTMRVSSSFMDSKGIDQEILQMELAPSVEQDNSHTLLSTAYIVNDGLNNKSCSYDYMCRHSMKIINGGENYTHASKLAITGGSGNGAIMEISSNKTGQITGWIINSGGSGYSNGDEIRYGVVGGADFGASYSASVDDDGKIIGLHVNYSSGSGQPFYGENAVVAGSAVRINSRTDGSGAVLTPVIVGNAIYAAQTTGAGTSPGSGYKRGDIVGVTGGGGTGFSAYVGNVNASGQISSLQYFDQGYNYDRIPLLRWAQSYQNDDSFCYGRGYEESIYVGEDGKKYELTNIAEVNQLDPCLSAEYLLGNKEDEFASGIFHKGGADQQFQLYKPVIYLDRGSTENFMMGMSKNEFGIGNKGIECTHQTRNVTLDNDTQEIQYNVLSTFPVGACIWVYFRLRDVANPTPAQLQTLQNEFVLNYGGIMCVGANDVLPGRESALTTNDTRRIIWGSPTRYDASGASNVTFNNPNGSTTTYTYESMNGGVVSNVQLYNNPSYNCGVNSQDFVVNTTIVGTETGEANGNGCTLMIRTNAAGVITNVLYVDAGGNNYNEGDILRLDSAPDFPAFVAGTSYAYVSRIDDTAGQNIMGHNSIQKNQFVLSTGEEVQCCLIHLPFYQSGIGMINIPEGFGTINVNSWCAKKTFGSTAFAGCIVNPPTFENFYLSSNDFTAGNEEDSKYYAGLYRQTGQVKGEENYSYSNDTNIFHDSKASITINNPIYKTTNNDWGFASANLTLGNDLVNSHIYTPSGTITADTFIVKFNIALFKAIPNITQDSHIPTQGYFVFANNNGQEEHWFLGGATTWDATHVEVTLAARNVHGLLHTGSVLNPASAALVGTNFINGYSYATSGNPVHPAGTYECQFIWKPVQIANVIVQMPQTTGTIPFTSMQNFYNTNDINYDKLTTLNGWKRALLTELSSEALNSYNGGGTYYLTHGFGNLSPQNNYNNERDSKFFGFSRGFGELLIQENNTENYKDGQGAPLTYNNSQLANNAAFIYNYEKVFQTKTFTITRDFVVPSDVANYWNRISHDRTGFIDRDTGEELLSKEQTGLIQNEFVFPVYGSNNRIAPDGTYIKDGTLFPYTSGLEGGHIVGIGSVRKDEKWIVGDIATDLPIMDLPHLAEFNNKSCYFCFFRTAWTMVRNYDPLAFEITAGGGIGPDRTPLKTLSTEAENVGNAVLAVQPGTAGGPNTYTELLDGTTMVWGRPPQDLSANPVIPAPQDPTAKIAELVVPTDGTGSGGYVNATNKDGEFPSFAVGYPVKVIIDDSLENKLARAKASQYVGATNMTMAFSSTLSSFSFTFFFTPYTSPFTDGQGGDISTRIFYGNRRVGVKNHDALSGINVENYCRPPFPRGTFCEADVAANIKIVNMFENGINPERAANEIGLRFLNKLGFTNDDIGVVNNVVNNLSPNVGQTYIAQSSTTFPTDAGNKVINVFDLTFNGTNGALLGSDIAVLASIEAPENTASIDTNNKKIVPSNGSGKIQYQQWGDYIFYPYSLSSGTNSFNETTANVRFDNATDAFGSKGGMRLTGMFRGMGLPNTQGSTTLVDDKSIPRVLNCDCNLYLSYTIQSDSNLKLASGLPRKMSHGHLLILSSLIEEPNFIMSKAGAVNGMSIINKSYITGDFVLTNGQLQWYAKRDRIISEITSKIVNTNYEPPTILGDNTTIIYEIINYNPTPMSRPKQIVEIQDMDYQIMSLLNQHLDQTSRGETSALTELEGSLYNLGVGTLSEAKPDLVAQLRDQINALQLSKLTPIERAQFFRTPEGQIFLENARDMQNLSQRVRDMEDTHQDIISGYGTQEAVKTFNEQRQALAREIRHATTRVAERTPQSFYTPSLPVEQQIPILDRFERKEVNDVAFRYGIENRHRAYTQYKLERAGEGRFALPFDVHQNFIYGNVLQPRDPTNPPAIRKQIEDDIGDWETYGMGAEPGLRPAAFMSDPVKEAYANSPYLSEESRTNPDIFNRESEMFRRELESGTAELNYLQSEILKSGGYEYNRDPRTGLRVVRQVERPGLAELAGSKEYKGIVFKTPEAKQEAQRQMEQLHQARASLGLKRGKPSAAQRERLSELELQKAALLDRIKGENYAGSKEYAGEISAEKLLYDNHLEGTESILDRLQYADRLLSTPSSRNRNDIAHRDNIIREVGDMRNELIGNPLESERDQNIAMEIVDKYSTPETESQDFMMAPDSGLPESLEFAPVSREVSRESSGGYKSPPDSGI